MTVEELVKVMYNGGGFTAKKIGVAENIIKDMLNDNSTIFLSFPADIISTGTRGVIRDIVKMNLVDVLITTCGMLDHDIARAYKDYYHGKFEMDDIELHKKEINRLGNILIPNDCYGEILEKTLQPIFSELYAQ